MITLVLVLVAAAVGYALGLRTCPTLTGGPHQVAYQLLLGLDTFDADHDLPEEPEALRCERATYLATLLTTEEFAPAA